MNNFISLRKALIASLLSFVMLFCITVQPQVYAKGEQPDPFLSNYNVVTDDDHQLVIQTEIPSNDNSFARAFTTGDSESKNITGSMTLDKETKEITLKTNEISEVSNENGRTYNVVINDVKENGDIEAVFTDIETNESYVIEQDKLHASFAWMIPIGVIIGEWLLAQLLAAATAIMVGSLSYVLVTEIVETLRNNRSVDHYMAKVMQGRLFVSNSLNLAQAQARLMNMVQTENNVWSRNAALAAAVAASTVGKMPIGPEVTCEQLPWAFYYTHFHTWNRVGGHSFF